LTPGSLITKETLVTGKELDRNAARRLAIIRHAEEVTGNMAMTYRPHTALGGHPPASRVTNLSRQYS
jgi:hypothetical protein